MINLLRCDRVFDKMNHEQQKPSRVPDRLQNDCRSSEPESPVAHLHHGQLTKQRDRSGSQAASRRQDRDRERLGEGASVMVEVITTAVVTVIVVIMAQLAWAQVKYKAKLRKRRLRAGMKRHFGTHTHRILPHRHKSHRYVTTAEHQTELRARLDQERLDKQDRQGWETTMKAILNDDNEDDQPEYNVAP